jgi:hypothetical protein
MLHTFFNCPRNCLILVHRDIIWIAMALIIVLGMRVTYLRLLTQACKDGSVHLFFFIRALVLDVNRICPLEHRHILILLISFRWIEDFTETFADCVRCFQETFNKRF